MNASPMVVLRDGREMPQLGLGVWQVPDDQAISSVSEALHCGYRAVDTAAIYRNEHGVGQAIKQSGISRQQIFVTTKLWNEDQGYDRAMQAIDSSLSKLNLEYVDLYLIHWPSPRRGLYTESWKALVEIKKSGRAKSIGVSNFMSEHLQDIMDATGEVPVVNQVELHPRFQQRELRAFHDKHNIFTQSWSPLGQGKILQEPVIQEIARKYGKTPAQIVIRWHLQNNLIVIPKSVTPTRIQENFDVFNFKLESSDFEAIQNMDDPNGRASWHPLTADF